MARWSFVILSSVLLLAIIPVGVTAAENVSFSSSIQWQGQNLTVSGDAVENDTTYELWRVESYDDQYPRNVNNSTFVEAVISNSSGDIQISTVDLTPGDYFLRGDGLPYQPEQDDVFEVAVQDLIAEFETTNVEPGLGTMLNIDSNRAQYNIDVSSPDLNESDLTRIFVEHGGFKLATNQPAGSSIRLEESGDIAEPAIFPSSLHDGEYTFEFNVVDTTAAHTESISIEQKSGVNMSISPTRSSVTAGEQTEFIVTLTGASDGVSEYKFSLSHSNTTFANISNIRLSGASQNHSENKVNITQDGATVDIDELSFSRLQSERLLRFDIDAEQKRVSKFTIDLSDIKVQTENNGNYSVSDVESTEVTIRDPDRVNTEAKDIVWKGQIAVDDGDHITPDTAYDVRRVTETDDGQVSESILVSQVLSSSSGQIKIETRSLDQGRYFITDDFDSTNITDTFQVVAQTLDANFASDSVEHDGEVGLVFNSNRAQYDLVVSSDDVSEKTLIQAFVINGTFDLVDRFPGADNQIMIAVPSSGTNIVDFNTIESGTHTFSFKTPVTNLTSTAEIAVGNPPVSKTVPEAIDTDNNNEIGDMEILTAIDYWQTRESVPGTDGKRIRDSEILDLIERWRYNSEI